MTRPRLIVLLSVLALLVWFFAEALFGGGVFAFRDAGHYYYPLFDFVRGEWHAGRVPLWNPYENLGVPLAGNPTSSVCYPGTLLFLLPLDYAWAFKLYVMGHVLLAAWAAYRLSRRWGGSVEASGVAAMSYAFCANVLFQYCNVIFLVGAAWLPLAVLAAERMLGEGSGFRVQGSGNRGKGTGDRGQGFGGRIRAALLFGAVLALMTLGGNAELAYHAGLMAAMYALWLWWYERRGRREGSASAGSGDPRRARGDPRRARDPAGTRERLRGRSLVGRLVASHPALLRLAASQAALLALAAIAALLLSAVQTLPSAELTRLSGRAVSSVPRTAYEVPGYLLRGNPSPRAGDARWTDGLTCRRLEPGTHHAHVYHFSVGPWRLAEYVWPNFSGRQFPTNRRWLAVIPAEGRVWVPSLYMGLFPLLLALASMRLRRGDVRESWLSWLVILSVAASFGWYGLGWLVHEFRAAAGGGAGHGLVGAPFGGLYWLMTVLLPGYVYFRYPAKLLVIAALGWSMLAARGWDRAFGGSSPRVETGLLWLGGASLAAMVLLLAILPFWQPWLAAAGPDVLFGPLDGSGAAADLLLGLLHTAVLCGLFWWLLRRTSRGARWPQTAALVLVAVDLAVANGWMVVCAPADCWQQPPKLATAIGQDQARRGDHQPYRVLRAPIWLPPAWSSSASPDRIARSLQWDRDTLFAKHNLPARIPIAEVEGTMKPCDYQVALWVRKRGRGSFSLAEESCVPFFAEYLILPGNGRVPEMEPITLAGTDAEGLEDVSLWHNPAHLPRAWIVHQVDVLPPLDSADPYQLWQRTEAVFCPEGYPRDLRKSAVVETEGAPFMFSRADQRPVDSEPLPESCRVVRDEPSRVQIEAELQRPGLVVLCDQFYPGWRLEVQTAGEGTRQLPILRANRVMRGAWLPAGRHRLTYRYRPAAFLWGAWLSGVGWIGLAAMGVTTRLLRRSRRRRIEDNAGREAASGAWQGPLS